MNVNCRGKNNSDLNAQNAKIEVLLMKWRQSYI